ncbi:unnamed protein product, partial [Ectocarpus fasciculatus]
MRSSPSLWQRWYGGGAGVQTSGSLVRVACTRGRERRCVSPPLLSVLSRRRRRQGDVGALCCTIGSRRQQGTTAVYSCPIDCCRVVSCCSRRSSAVSSCSCFCWRWRTPSFLLLPPFPATIASVLPPSGDSPFSPSPSGPVFAASLTLPLSSLSLSLVPLSSVNVTDPRSSESTEALPSPSPASPPPPQDESWMEPRVASEPAAGEPGAAMSRQKNPPPPPPPSRGVPVRPAMVRASSRMGIIAAALVFGSGLGAGLCVSESGKRVWVVGGCGSAVRQKGRQPARGWDWWGSVVWEDEHRRPDRLSASAWCLEKKFRDRGAEVLRCWRRSVRERLKTTLQRHH